MRASGRILKYLSRHVHAAANGIGVVFISKQDVPLIMSAEDVLKNTSLVAILTGVLGLIAIWKPAIGVLLLGLIALLFGLIGFLRNKKDIIALIAIIVGAIVVLVSILVLADVIHINYN